MNPPHHDHFSSLLLCSFMLHIDLFFPHPFFFLLCFPLLCFCWQRLDVVSHIKQVIYFQYVLTHLEKIMEKVSNDTDLLFASTDSIPPARPCPCVQQAWILNIVVTKATVLIFTPDLQTWLQNSLLGFVCGTYSRDFYCVAHSPPSALCRSDILESSVVSRDQYLRNKCLLGLILVFMSILHILTVSNVHLYVWRKK